MQSVAPPALGPAPSDSDLVAAARAGEPWAVDALFQRYAPMVNGLALRLMGRRDDVDDLVQDCFVEALSNWRKLREPSAFSGWLKSIVVHRAAKLIRRRQIAAKIGLGRARLTIDVDALIAPAVPADVATELRAVYQRVQELPADLRTVLILRRVEGYSLDEIGQITRVSLATVKRRLAAAERSIRREDGKL